MFNKVIFAGNLTKDVDLRYLPSGSAIGILGLASNRKFKKQDGTQGEEVCFVDVKLFGRTAEVANQYLRKGSKILIEGKLTYETWTDQSGVKKSKLSITAEKLVMLGSNQAQNQNQAQPQPQVEQKYQNWQNAPEVNMNMPEINIDDDEIPF